MQPQHEQGMYIILFPMQEGKQWGFAMHEPCADWDPDKERQMSSEPPLLWGILHSQHQGKKTHSTREKEALAIGSWEPCFYFWYQTVGLLEDVT